MSRSLNYAKWDNIDTDSDSDINASLGTLNAEPADPTRGDSDILESTGAPFMDDDELIAEADELFLKDVKDDELEKSLAAIPPVVHYSGMVQAMRILCVRDKQRVPFYPVFLPFDHILFHQNPTPLSTALEIPLVMLKEGVPADKQNDAEGNVCRIATFLAVELDGGIAPPYWQGNNGNVLVARKDGKPLTPQHLEGFWDYSQFYLMDMWGEEDASYETIKPFYTRPAFERYWRRHVREEMKRRSEPNSSDNFSLAGSPYMM